MNGFQEVQSDTFREKSIANAQNYAMVPTFRMFMERLMLTILGVLLSSTIVSKFNLKL